MPIRMKITWSRRAGVTPSDSYYRNEADAMWHLRDEFGPGPGSDDKTYLDWLAADHGALVTMEDC